MKVHYNNGDSMSALDDNAKEIAEDTGGEGDATSSPEINTKKQDNRSAGPVILFFIIGLFGMDHFSEAALLEEKTADRF
jgi:hypothetical protein